MHGKNKKFPGRIPWLEPLEWLLKQNSVIEA
jgi:hypothetical protein